MVSPDDMDEVEKRFREAVQDDNTIGRRWKERASSDEAQSKFVSGLTDIRGISSVDDDVVGDFSDGVDEVSASDFEESLSGDAVVSSFRKNFIEGITGNSQR